MSASLTHDTLSGPHGRRDRVTTERMAAIIELMRTRPQAAWWTPTIEAEFGYQTYSRTRSSLKYLAADGLVECLKGAKPKSTFRWRLMPAAALPDNTEGR